jgi:MFS family permease
MRERIGRALGTGGGTVVLLGIVSLFADVSTEMTVNVLPIYLTGALGVSVVAIGVIEGIAESTSAVTRLVAGSLSDRLPRRLPVMFAGYGMSAVTKPLFALVAGPGLAGSLRFVDRLGKARGAARDALIADVTASDTRGLAFGLHRAMDALGAVLGVLAAAGVVWWLAGDGALSRGAFQRLALMAGIPAALSVLVLARVREVSDGTRPSGSRAPLVTWPRSTGESRYLLVVALFALGNSSDVFIILKMLDVGVGAATALLLLALMNLSHVVLAVPAGALSDRVGRRHLLFAGYVAYATIYVGFGVTDAFWPFVPLLVLYGAYYGATDGISRAYVADLWQSSGRGTAYGWYYAVTAGAALPASIIAGWLWVSVSPAATFVFGSVAALLAAVALTFVRPELVTSSGTAAGSSG